VGATIVRVITIKTANEGRERYPKTVTLYGSNEGSITNYSSVIW
jgi:hypothetical protein